MQNKKIRRWKIKEEGRLQSKVSSFLVLDERTFNKNDENYWSVNSLLIQVTFVWNEEYSRLKSDSC